MEEWINIDKYPTDATDFVVDVRYGLPFRNLECIYAEHFLEHLAFPEIMAFLRECRRVLQSSGVLRLTTPNLDWVYHTHYQSTAGDGHDRAIRNCFALNKAFRGWGHRFLFNGLTLSAVLHDAGFADIQPAERGRSRHAHLCGLEHHESYSDLPGIPHLLVVEAAGTRPSGAESVLREGADDYLLACSAR